MAGVVRRVVVVVVCLTAGACSGGTDEPAPAPGSGDQAAIPVGPRLPHVRGPVALVVEPALRMVGGPGCVPRRGVACTRDRTASYRLFERPRRVVLVDASTRPADGGTSWTTVLRFERRGRSALRAVARSAAGVGGVVLVRRRGGPVLLLAAVPEIEGRTIRYEELAKPEAWRLVRALR